MLTTAEKSDKAGERKCRVTFFKSVLYKKLMVDGCYSGALFADFVKTVYGTEVEVVKRNELHKFAVLPKR